MSKKNHKLAVKLRAVTKMYQLHHQKPTLIETFFKKSNQDIFTAIDHVTLDIPQGQKLGIIGSNGSGKTTLLKIIAGIATPNQGSVWNKGSVVSLIDLEAGFHPDLTGRENIFLNGLIIGMSKQDIQHKLSSIIEFAEIGAFINEPLYTYSHGMKLRLGFSIAVHANPDVLILDEEINTGDEFFQQKSQAKLEAFFKQGKTIIIVSHWLSLLKQLCDRIIWLDHGRIKKDGGAEVITAYRNFSRKRKVIKA